jgi:hypothetical protein
MFDLEFRPVTHDFVVIEIMFGISILPNVENALREKVYERRKIRDP